MQDSTEYGHKTVLLHEVIDGLNIKAGDVYVDGTLGSGGHAEEVAKLFGDQVQIIGIDMDEKALERSKTRLEKVGTKAEFVQGNFRNIDTVLDALKITKVNEILLDLGLSSNQLEESGRGFSFQKDEPLTMTFKETPKSDEVTAAVILNEWSEETLETILKGFGEEKFSRQIAKAVVLAREVKPIVRTNELVEIIQSAVPNRYLHGKTHFATRTFQALRIAVNDELRALQEGLTASFEKLAPEGRLAVISFHSLEDRIVKNFFREKAKELAGKLITKKPIVPSDEEEKNNRRSRSAKLRIIEKI